MNIQNNKNITFGQLIPTKALLKSALGIHKFEDAKILNQSVGIKAPGHQGYHKRASLIASNAVEKNKNIQEILYKLKKLTPEQQEKEIINLVSKIGEEIDITI